MQKPLVSIIIPFQQPSVYLYECLDCLKKQSETNLEIILLPDTKEIYKYPKVKTVPTGKMGPAQKRDIGVKTARGEILAFIDDDAYPEKNWVKKAIGFFGDKNIAAVGGPGITPPGDDIFRQAGGWVNASWFGSGGAGTYRFIPRRQRFVDDFPTMNFFIRKKDFIKTGGFDTHFWPGEDTKLCYDLVYRLNKKILYTPSVLVYHHRKPLFLPHLRQISRYAIHRGHFSRILPKTSLRLGYLIPTFFVISIIFGVISLFLSSPLTPFFIVIYLLYLILLTLNNIYVFIKTRSLLISLFTGAGIFLTHVVYGLLFPIGFFKKSLKQ